VVRKSGVVKKWKDVSSLCGTYRENAEIMSIKMKEKTLRTVLRAYWCRAAADKR